MLFWLIGDLSYASQPGWRSSPCWPARVSLWLAHPLNLLMPAKMSPPRWERIRRGCALSLSPASLLTAMAVTLAEASVVDWSFRIY